MLHFLGRFLKVLRRAPRGRPRGRGGWLLFLLTCLVAYGTLGFMMFERDGALAELQSFGERLETSAWWTLVTLATVGYGDVFPRTWEGRWLVGVPLLILGIGLIGYAFGALATAVIDHNSRKTRGLVPYTKSGHVLICNCPSIDLVLKVARELRADPEWRHRDLVLVTDAFTNEPEELERSGIYFVVGNPCREEVLQRANVAGAHRAVILTQNPRDPACDSVNLGVLVTLRSLRPDLYVVSECQHAENYKLLRAARASEIVNAASLRAEMVTQGLTAPGVNAAVEDLLSRAGGHQFYLVELRSFTGTYGALLDRLVRTGKHVPLGIVVDGRPRLLPPHDTAVAPGSQLIVIGEQRPAGL